MASVSSISAERLDGSGISQPSNCSKYTAAPPTSTEKSSLVQAKVTNNIKIVKETRPSWLTRDLYQQLKPLADEVTKKINDLYDSGHYDEADIDHLLNTYHQTVLKDSAPSDLLAKSQDPVSVIPDSDSVKPVELATFKQEIENFRKNVLGKMETPLVASTQVVVQNPLLLYKNEAYRQFKDDFKIKEEELKTKVKETLNNMVSSQTITLTGTTDDFAKSLINNLNTGAVDYYSPNSPLYQNIGIGSNRSSKLETQNDSQYLRELKESIIATVSTYFAEKVFECDLHATVCQPDASDSNWRFKYDDKSSFQYYTEYPLIVSNGSHFTLYGKLNANGTRKVQQVPGDGACLFHCANFLKANPNF